MPAERRAELTLEFAHQQNCALALIYRDGIVGGIEIHTKIRGVAMRELGLPGDDPHDYRSVSSAVADLFNGAAVKAACGREMLSASWRGRAVCVAGRGRVPRRSSAGRAVRVFRERGGEWRMTQVT